MTLDFLYRPADSAMLQDDPSAPLDFMLHDDDVALRQQLPQLLPLRFTQHYFHAPSLTLCWLLARYSLHDEYNNTRTTVEKKSVSADVQEGGPLNNEEIFSPSAQDKVPASIKKFEASICQEPIENGRFYNDVGIPVTGVIKGWETGIDLKEYVGKVSGTIFTHNHPKSGFLSAADIEFAVHNNLKEIRAVTPEGVTMSFERTGDNWGENPVLTIDQAKTSFKERYSELYRTAVQQQNQKQIAEYNEVFVREMITAVAANNVAVLKIFK